MRRFCWRGATTYYHYDHLSPRVMTNTGGAIVAQSGHYPFGENWYETAANKLKFTTYERDNTPSEGGDDYAMLRSYINRFGRFSAPDLLAGRLPNPQTLNRYAYSLNNPINLSDPLGLSPCGDEPGMPPCPLLIEGGDPFGFGCTLDGISVGCGWVSRSTIYEVAVPCPNNICFGAAWDSRNNTWVNVQFVAFAGGTSGYFRPSDLTSGVHEFNGRIYNTANWNILVQMTFAERIDAQRHATARAIAEQSGGKISEQDAYARLSVDGGFLRGGNYNFAIDRSFFEPASQSCSAGRCDNGLHFENGFVHLDTANGRNFPWGTLVHNVVDVFLGNILWWVIPRT